MPVRPEFFLSCSEESPFYTAHRSIAERQADGPEPQEVQLREPPDGWLVRRWGGWESWTPRDWTPRTQGWKVHVSTAIEHASELLGRVTDVCVEESAAFKFLPLLGTLRDTNGKQHDRGASGKFVTVYPDDDAHCKRLVITLDAALSDLRGPYILSDLRYGDAPVFVRYGGIMPLNDADAHDRPVSSITSGPSNRLVPDQRTPRFVIPDGVELPAFLQPSYDRSRTSTRSRLSDFKAVSPLHFSNAGGVYRATLPDDTQRILREARSHTGLDARGRDAIRRQEEEEVTLRELRDVPGVQRIVDSFWAWEHRYLELEYAPGRALTPWVVQNTAFDPGEGGVKRRAYAARARHVAAQIVDIVERIHAAGWVVGDLHPGNILVSDDDAVTILDFEDATRVGADREIGFRVFEYCAPDPLDGVAADWYAVARCLMLMYVPAWEIEIISAAYWDVARARVRAEFGDECLAQIDAVTARYTAPERHLMASTVSVDVPAVPLDRRRALDALDAGIEWSRQFSPTGSFPGDPTPATDATESWSHGRAGVLWTRARLGRPVADSDADALVRATAGRCEDPSLGTGRAGIALALSEVGRHEDAARAASDALTEALGRKRLDLFGGQAGAILVALEVGRRSGDDALLTRARKANERLQRSTLPGTSAWADLTHRRGYWFGLSGLALLDLVQHLHTGEQQPLDRAVARLSDELAHCMFNSDGDLMVRDVDNNRALPYLEWGSAGVWAVVQLAERLTGRALIDAQRRAGAIHACSSDVYIYSTFDHGRGGTLAVLAGDGPQHAPEVDRQVDLMLASVLGDETGAFVPGDGLIRLSSDLATGAAGVMLALHVADGHPLAWLPVAADTVAWLEARPRPEPAARADEPVAELV